MAEHEKIPSSTKPPDSQKWLREVGSLLREQAFIFSSATATGIERSLVPAQRDVVYECSFEGSSTSQAELLRQIQGAYRLLGKCSQLHDFEYYHGSYGRLATFAETELGNDPKHFVSALDFLLKNLRQRIKPDVLAGLLRALGESSPHALRIEIARLLADQLNHDDPLVVDSALLALSTDDLNEPAAAHMIQSRVGAIKWESLRTEADRLAKELAGNN